VQVGYKCGTNFKLLISINFKITINKRPQACEQEEGIWRVHKEVCDFFKPLQ